MMPGGLDQRRLPNKFDAHSTSVNCSSRRALDQRKIVVGDHRQHGVALRRDMGVDAFHVVDLLAEIGVEDRGAIDHRAGRNRGERDAPDADADAGEPGKLPLQHQQIARRQQHRVADVEIVGAANAELAGRRAADQERDQVAVGIEAAFGDRDQRARQRQALRHHTSASSPLLYGSFLTAGGIGTTSPRARVKPLAEIEAQHLVDALEADIDERAIERDRFGIEPAARGDRPAVGAEHRRGLDVVEPGHLAALVDDAAGEPAALVADGNEALALGVEPHARQPAETAKRARSESARCDIPASRSAHASDRGCRTTATAGR